MTAALLLGLTLLVALAAGGRLVLFLAVRVADAVRLAELEEIFGLPERAAFTTTSWGPTDDELVRLAEHDRGNGLL